MRPYPRSAEWHSALRRPKPAAEPISASRRRIAIPSYDVTPQPHKGGQSPMNGTQSLAHYVQIVGALGPGEFEESHPHPFLVETRMSGSADEYSQFTTSRVQLDEIDVAPGALLARQGGHQVIPVTKRPGNAFPEMINVGRAQNNDIVLPFTSVSKFHAYFERDSSTGGFRLTDADSTNGSFVNQEQLKPDVPSSLREGDVVSFSPQHEFVFHSSAGFHKYALRMVEGP